MERYPDRLKEAKRWRHEGLQLRLKDPSLWTFKRLGEHYGVSQQAAQQAIVIAQKELEAGMAP